MKIVAIGHHKNVGKDQFVKFCIDVIRAKSRKVNVMRRGFADPIYDICYQLYGWAGFKPRQSYVEFPHLKNDKLATAKTVRETLIEMGQHLRKIDDDIWINAALRTANCDIMFLSDLRFPHEFLHCQSVKATMVRITRPGLEAPTDEADTALNGWDDRWNLTIQNDGDLNHLYNKASDFVNKILMP